MKKIIALLINIVTADGGILEEGTHDQLLSQSGHYADRYNTYFRHQSLSYIESEFLEITAVPP